jgi:HK97 family phage major capsid protein
MLEPQMASLRELLDQLDTITTELKAIVAAAGDQDMSDDQRSRFDTLKTRADALKERISRQSVIDDLERRAGGTPIHGASDSRFDALAAQVTAVDVIRAQMGGTDAACGRAREVSAELERRSGRKAEGLLFSMGTSGVERRVFSTTTPSGGPGSGLIQTTISPNMIDRLRQKTIVRKLGATVIGGLVGNLTIPRLKASASAQWIAETGAITEADPQIDGITFTPHHVGGIVQLSRNMIQQPSIDVAMMVENDLTKLIATALDQAALVGGGSNQPSGLLASLGGANPINVIYGGTNGAAPTWANVIGLIGAVDYSNALDGTLAFATNAKSVKAMRATSKLTGDTIGNFIMNDATELAGYPLASSQNVPNNLTRGTGSALSALFFGDWSMLCIGFWSELDILASPYADSVFTSGSVLVRCMATADVQIKQPLAFGVIPDIIAP